MSEYWTNSSTTPDIQVVGSNQVLDVVRISATTVPSGVTFDVLVPKQGFDDQNWGYWLDPVAEQIEYYIGSGQASSARYEEDLNANGTMTFWIVFTVRIEPPSETQPGPFETEIRVPVEALRDRFLIDKLVQPKFTAAQQHLKAWATR